jgi:hypothetical protein
MYWPSHEIVAAVVGWCPHAPHAWRCWLTLFTGGSSISSSGAAYAVRYLLLDIQITPLCWFAVAVRTFLAL